MNTPAPSAVSLLIRDWLQRNTTRFTTEAETDDYSVFLFQHPQTDGVIELITHPDLTQDAPRLVLTLPLDLPPIRSTEDAVLLLELAEWLTDASLVIKESGSNRPALQTKVPPAALTAPEDLTPLFNRLLKSKAFFEEE